MINSRLEFQSDVIPALVKDILAKGRCMLSSLKEYALQHKLLLDALLESWNKFNYVNLVVPIT